tara:strand:- start:3004 stop:3417 length:414 start_codon:yes stop_codon:yes gene_type:complete
MILKNRAFLLIPLLLLMFSPKNFSDEHPELYFVNIQDGQHFNNPIKIIFGLKNYGVAPAGIKVDFAGHHHLLIDKDLEDYAQPIPADNNHIHFGKGQTETTIVLSPGSHTLQLIMGNYVHIPHNPVIQSEKITVIVK